MARRADETIHDGRCACGRIAFRAVGDPSWAAYCHCRDCRRASGAPFSLWVGFPRRAVLLTGSPMRRPAGATATRAFCLGCGAPVAYEDAAIEGEPEIYLAIGLFEAPERIVPQAHAFWRERLPGLAPEDGLPRFDAFSRARLPTSAERDQINGHAWTATDAE